MAVTRSDKLPTIHLRHHDIRDQQGNVPFVFLYLLNGLVRSSCRDHFIPQVFKNRLAEFQDSLVVLDQENRLFPSRITPVGSLPSSSLPFRTVPSSKRGRKILNVDPFPGSLST